MTVRVEQRKKATSILACNSTVNAGVAVACCTMTSMAKVDAASLVTLTRVSALGTVMSHVLVEHI